MNECSYVIIAVVFAFVKNILYFFEIFCCFRLCSMVNCILSKFIPKKHPEGVLPRSAYRLFAFFTFKEWLYNMPQETGEVITEKAKRIKEHPDGTIKAEGKIFRRMVFSFTVELHENTDDTIVRDMLGDISVITTNDIFVLFHANDAVHDIASVG